MAYLGEFEQLILFFALLDLGKHAYGVAIRESIEELGAFPTRRALAVEPMEALNVEG